MESENEHRFTVISSDGHACAEMRDYRPYLEADWQPAFDEFLKRWDVSGGRGYDPDSLRRKIDDMEVERWERDVVHPGRLAGESDPRQRLIEMEREGAVGEVLFPDFRLPFELYGPGREAEVGMPARSEEELQVSARAHNRWVVDFCSYAPKRFAAMALIRFTDVEAAVREIRWAKSAGLRGIMMPTFTLQAPLFDPRFDPIWSELEELQLPVNCHTGISGIIPLQLPSPQHLAHPTAALPMFSSLSFFYAQQLLNQLIWGGVLERHPLLTVVFTEMGSGWVPGALESMDYKHDRSYLRQDIHEIVPRRPSEYFGRQCFIGSSLLSTAEAAARHTIGIEKMMVGIDYPHHEGTWNGGTQDYLQATMGAARVPAAEADTMLGKTAAAVFGFDWDELSQLAQTVGPTVEEILSVPSEDKFPRGDAHKPLTLAH
jgi:predicted TIM-barrel fold metal-dependent hydrolase